MNIKSYITTTKDVLGNTYLVIKFENDDIIKNIINNWNIDSNIKQELVEKQSNRDNNSHHITILNVVEYKKLDKKLIQQIIHKEISLELIGIGKAIDEKKGNESHFIVVDSKQLDDYRIGLELKPHDFHITIGFDKKDVFGKPKNKTVIYEEIE